MELMLREIRRRRVLINIPFALARLEAFFLERLPGPILTRDQVKLLERDTVVAPGASGLGDLGITPTAVELVLPTYLEAYRRGGRYADTRTGRFSTALRKTEIGPGRAGIPLPG